MSGQEPWWSMARDGMWGTPEEEVEAASVNIDKGERGIVIPSPMKFTPGTPPNLYIGQPDLQDLRFCLLFWDKLVVAETAILGMPLPNDADFLEDEGILRRLRMPNNDASKVPHVLVNAHLMALRRLDHAQPGVWALAEGRSEVNLAQAAGEAEGRDLLVQLHRAVPIPSEDTPLQDILELRLRRRDELLALRFEVEEFYQAIRRAPDKALELRRRVEMIDRSCTDLLRVTREAKMPFRLTSPKVSLKVTGDTLARWAIGVGQAINMPSTTSLLLAAASFSPEVLGSFISIGTDVSLRDLPARLVPYKYAFRIESELG